MLDKNLRPLAGYGLVSAYSGCLKNLKDLNSSHGGGGQRPELGSKKREGPKLGRKKAKGLKLGEK